uniref:Uncharacterized protein n=1 Tax=Picea sitchensis TaxID=3332 RepID=C0PSJ9_PICSI|nr:unknown [Picea sitchensis]
MVHTPPKKIKAEIDLAEEDVIFLRHFVFGEEVNTNIFPWIPDPSSSRAKESKYYRTVELYWQSNMLMGKVLLDRNELHQDVQL